MARLFAARWFVLAYGFGGLALGFGFSVWVLGDKLSTYFRHPDGEVTTSRISSDTRIDPASGKINYVSVVSGRPLTRIERFWVDAGESLPIWTTAALVGAFWGLVHHAMRTAWRPAADEQNRLDYGDSIAQYRPPGST